MYVGETSKERSNENELPEYFAHQNAPLTLSYIILIQIAVLLVRFSIGASSVIDSAGAILWCTMVLDKFVFIAVVLVLGLRFPNLFLAHSPLLK